MTPGMVSVCTSWSSAAPCFYNSRAIYRGSPFQPPAGDLPSLDLVRWKRHAVLSLFKLGDGRVVYTDGRDVARSRPTAEGGINVRVAEWTAGSTESLP
eukprot:1417891-Pleurochrysis_carterae.AAC.1